MVDGRHHEGVAIDVPCGRAPHQDEVVAGEEHHGRGHRVVVAAGDVACQQQQTDRPQAAHQGGRNPLGGQAAGRDALHSPRNPCGKRRLLQSELAVHGGHQPVAVAHHLPPCHDVARLHDVRGQRAEVGEEGDEHEKAQQKPVSFFSKQSHILFRFAFLHAAAKRSPVHQGRNP